MEKFWAVILIFAIVAAGGLLYVNQVYAPQKEAQVAMADTANQTLTAVKVEMENDASSREYSVREVIEQVEFYCSMYDIEITVDSGPDEVTYPNGTKDIEDQLSGITGKFKKTSEYDDSELESVKFEIIEN